MSFTACRTGLCVECESRITIGDHVRYHDESVIHVGCEPHRTERPCDECFTFHAGECA
jgi:hypothetical protein